jgi:hypothetical protein
MIMRTCHRCKQDKLATKENFFGDKSRPLGLSYECRPCHSARKKGRDRRRERWSNMTPEQKIRRRAVMQKYAKTQKGRAVFLRKAYQKIDACDLTVDEVLEIITQPCTHCGTTTENRGLDRIDNSLPHTKGNVVSSCAPCNFARGDRFTFEEMKEIGAVIRLVLERRGTKQQAIQNEDRQGNCD